MMNTLNKLKWTTLTTIAAGSGLALVIMIKLLDGKRQEFAANAAFIDSAAHLLRSQPQVVKLFGDPLEVGKASFYDGWSKMGQFWVQLKVPVKGSEDQGSMYTYAKKFCKESPLRLYRLEVTFNKIENKRLVLLDLSDEQLEKLEKVEREKLEQNQKKAIANPNEPNKSDYHNLRRQQALAVQKEAVKSSESEKN